MSTASIHSINSDSHSRLVRRDGRKSTQEMYTPPSMRGQLEPGSARERRPPLPLYVPPRRRLVAANQRFNRPSSPGLSTCSEIVTSWRTGAAVTPPCCMSPQPRIQESPTSWRQSRENLPPLESPSGAANSGGDSPKKRSGGAGRRRRRRSGRRPRSSSEDRPAGSTVQSPCSPLSPPQQVEPPRAPAAAPLSPRGAQNARRGERLPYQPPMARVVGDSGRRMCVFPPTPRPLRNAPASDNNRTTGTARATSLSSTTGSQFTTAKPPLSRLQTKPPFSAPLKLHIDASPPAQLNEGGSSGVRQGVGLLKEASPLSPTDLMNALRAAPDSPISPTELIQRFRQADVAETPRSRQPQMSANTADSLVSPTELMKRFRLQDSTGSRSTDDHKLGLNQYGQHDTGSTSSVSGLGLHESQVAPHAHPSVHMLRSALGSIAGDTSLHDARLPDSDPSASIATNTDVQPAYLPSATMASGSIGRHVMNLGNGHVAHPGSSYVSYNAGQPLSLPVMSSFESKVEAVTKSCSEMSSLVPPYQPDVDDASRSFIQSLPPAADETPSSDRHVVSAVEAGSDDTSGGAQITSAAGDAQSKLYRNCDRDTSVVLESGQCDTAAALSDAASSPTEGPVAAEESTGGVDQTDTSEHEESQMSVSDSLAHRQLDEAVDVDGTSTSTGAAGRLDSEPAASLEPLPVVDDTASTNVPVDPSGRHEDDVEDIGEASSSAPPGSTESSPLARQSSSDPYNCGLGSESFDWADEVEEWERRMNESSFTQDEDASGRASPGLGRDYVDDLEDDNEYDDPRDRTLPPHVIELSGFPAEFTGQELGVVFQDFQQRGFDLCWVDDTHALAVFSSPACAAEALCVRHPMVCCRPLSQATDASRRKACRRAETLQPHRPRPETCAVQARRMVASALGIRSPVTREQRDQEKQQLKGARDKKRLTARQKDDAWEGRF